MNNNKIIVAEDNDHYRSELINQLKTEFTTVIGVTDGQQALELITQGEPFDLLITDYQMPHLTGTQLITQLTNQGFTQPMILWTAMIPLPNCPSATAIISKFAGYDQVIKIAKQYLSAE